jgi:hypothetical protein
MVALLLGVEWLLRRHAAPGPMGLVLVQLALGFGYYGAFVLLAPFGAMREVVAEVLGDLAPRVAPLFASFTGTPPGAARVGPSSTERDAGGA